MYWIVNYIIDDGYDSIKKVSIIKADSELDALEILRNRIGNNLTDDYFIVSKYIEITKCEDEELLYDGLR